MVRSRCSCWSSRFRFRRHAIKTLGPGNEGIRNELEVCQAFIAFRENSRRIKTKIINAFFLRSAALGKSCILHIECFTESA